MDDRILVLATGGTIDDLEYSDERDAPKDRHSIIPSLISKIHPDAKEVRFEELMLKDSEFITDGDREKMLKKNRKFYRKQNSCDPRNKNHGCNSKIFGNAYKK